MATVSEGVHMYPFDHTGDSLEPAGGGGLQGSVRSRGRGCGRGHRSNRGRVTDRGSALRRGKGPVTIISRLQRVSSYDDPYSEWRLFKPHSQGIIMGCEFSSFMMAERARIFCCSVMSQLKVELVARELSATWSGVLILLCRTGMKERIALQ